MNILYLLYQTINYPYLFLYLISTILINFIFIISLYPTILYIILMSIYKKIEYKNLIDYYNYNLIK